MAGGLMNLVSYGNQNIILNGNPSKTFFKCVYSKYTNFGLQKFRIDFTGQRQLHITQESVYNFTIPRYADLLMDTYLVVNLPNIWSPILTPEEVTSITDISGNTRPLSALPNPEYSQWRPYEFKWIDNIGSNIVKQITFLIGGQIIQQFSGDYMYNLVERDFNYDKKLLYYQMTGNTSNLNNPAYYNNNNGNYPNAWYTSSDVGTEPSIRAQTLYIPINIWFTLASQMAFPLVSLQYNELQIQITLRPIDELFVIRNVFDVDNYWRIPKNVPFYQSGVTGGQWVNHPNTSVKAPYIKPYQTNQAFAFYRFLSQPAFENLYTLDVDRFPNKNTNWNADIHLISTYGFLSEDEVKVFASKPQDYLIKEIYELSEYNIVGNTKISLNSMGLISNWMFYLQRTDVIERNQWNNYTNWPYNEIPDSLIDASPYGIFTATGTQYVILPCCSDGPHSIGPGLVPNFWFLPSPNTVPIEPNNWYNLLGGYGPGTNPSYKYGGTGIKITGDYSDINQKTILQSLGILLDGKYRENVFPVGIYNQIEKYVRTSGYASDSGLNCYNFALNSNPIDFQPSGAINLSKFNSIQFELQTYNPPLDPNAQTSVICDSSGEIIGINKPIWSIYKYTYNFKLFEERYNILKIISGNGSLAYAR